jgi:hypothetical protein
MSAQREAGGIDVEADLGLKGVERRELLFRPELLDELHLDFGAVQVAAEVEEMDFEAGNGTAGVDGGAEAEVEDGEVIRVTETDAGRVDAVGRKFEVGEVDVGGREPEGATELPAVGDGPGEGIGAAKEFGDIGQIAVAEGCADAGRRDAFVADVDGGGLVGDEAEFASEFAQEGDVAGPTVAELEAAADGDRAQAAEAGSELADEAVAIDLGQFPGEVDREDGIDAEGAEGPEALGERLQQARGAVGEDDGERVRIEGHDHRTRAEGAGVEDGVSDDVLVTQVNAVEHPQREANACAGAAEFGWITEETHAAGATRTA